MRRPHFSCRRLAALAGPLCLLTLLCGSAHDVHAQGAGAPAEIADRNLNAGYQQTLGSLGEAEKKRLRASERAWLLARDKTAAAFRAAAAGVQRSSEQIDSMLTGEVNARSSQLRRLAAATASEPADAGRAERADAALNALYRQCLAAIDVPAQERLREAQRAWLEFRDAEARVKPPLALGQTALVTERRVQQLAEFYLRTGTLPAKNNPAPSPRVTAENEETDPSIPNPFERAR